MMGTKMPVRVGLGFGCLIVAFLWSGVATASSAENHTTILGGQTLQPGDVINFQGGLAHQFGRVNKYGHSAMYLGHDDSSQPIFLDVTMAQQKILPQDEFAKRYYQADPDRKFDVFRPQAPIPPNALQATARDIAANVEWGPGGEPTALETKRDRMCVKGECVTDERPPVMVCGQAVLECLDRATHGRITRLKEGEKGLWRALVEATPNAFADPEALGPFFRQANANPLQMPPSEAYERAKAWYEREIALAGQACRTAKADLEKSQNTLERAEALARNALPSDTAGRSVAQQAAATARTAIEKNTMRRDRSCDRHHQLLQGLGRLEQVTGAVAIPVMVRGKVLVDTETGPQPWDGRTPLQPGQKIRTGHDGYAEFFLTDEGGKMVLNKNSLFELSDERPHLMQGQFYYLKEEIRGLFKQEHPHVLLGSLRASVRGTEFVAEVNPGFQSVLVVFSGEVALTDPKTRQEVVVRGGQAVVFSESKGVESPTAADPQKLRRWWEE